jgi:protein kinase C substrate 80K-H
LVKRSDALKSLQSQYKALQEREKALSDVLRNLKQGYNPNYQDMAVLEAVRGWDGLNSEAANEAVTEGPSTEADQETPPATEEVNTWDDAAINKLLGEDSVSLLLQHDAHVAEDDTPDEGM